MVRIGKYLKVEIESSNGTATDITRFVKSVDWDNLKPDPRPVFWRHPVAWVRDWLWRRRMKRLVMPSAKIEITGRWDGE